MSAVPPFREFEKPLSDDAGRSYTMPARYYIDPDVYEREKEAIFARTWHYVGHESHVRDPGDYLTLQIADESVFVMRGDDGRLRGFFNGTLGPEDQGLCESVQRGLKSRSYDQGRFMVDPARSGTAEHGLHQFHRLVTRALNDGFHR